ncbi:WRKY transcription factor 32 [Pyrus ussuriensis x Pyrus communis]|uniref:WRKY transcription factor 32 n=1 Tax=Pyrus ussuriensis x Pyrus communis TaxID=2448454 RepID=A0A5N5GPB3_9ROSA|nr:WRKY transcription factor 32 [Pyrus ussuriensis x Pyrus communis]
MAEHRESSHALPAEKLQPRKQEQVVDGGKIQRPNLTTRINGQSMARSRQQPPRGSAKPQLWTPTYPSSDPIPKFVFSNISALETSNSTD